MDDLSRTSVTERAEKRGKSDSKRLEELRQQVQSGSYEVSAEEVARALIKEHLKETSK